MKLKEKHSKRFVLKMSKSEMNIMHGIAVYFINHAPNDDRAENCHKNLWIKLIK